MQQTLRGQALGQEQEETGSPEKPFEIVIAAIRARAGYDEGTQREDSVEQARYGGAELG